MTHSDKINRAYRKWMNGKKHSLIPGPYPLFPFSFGFTLVEMAMVMIVIGLVMMAVFPALTAMRAASQTSLTQSNLHNLMLATAAYVQANGCLPCPANPATIGTNFGTTGNAVACASLSSNGTVSNACTSPEGIAPFVALGIPAAIAHDGWGHWITMRIDPVLNELYANAANCAASSSCSLFIPPTQSCSATDDANGYCVSTQSVGTSGKALCKANLSTSKTYISVTTPGGATQKAAVIFVSHGVNGYGSFFAQAASIGLMSANGLRLPFPGESGSPSCATGYAECNASGTTQFTDASYLTGSNYDDILAYSDRNTIVSMLGNGSCSTVW